MKKIEKKIFTFEKKFFDFSLHIYGINITNMQKNLKLQRFSQKTTELLEQPNICFPRIFA